MIYIIRTKNCTPSYLKVGYTNDNLRRRFTEIQVGCPHELEVVVIRQGSEAKEKELHKRLKHHRVRNRGEWFHNNIEVCGILEIDYIAPSADLGPTDRQRNFKDILFQIRGSTRLLADFCYEFKMSESEIQEMRSVGGFEIINDSLGNIPIRCNFQGPPFHGERAMIWAFRNQ